MLGIIPISKSGLLKFNLIRWVWFFVFCFFFFHAWKELVYKGEELPVSMEAYQELLYHFQESRGLPCLQSVIEEGGVQKNKFFSPGVARLRSVSSKSLLG